MIWESTADCDAEKKKLANNIELKEDYYCQKRARRVITESRLLLLKYQKQVITPMLNGEDFVVLFPTALRKSWLNQVSAGTLHLSGIKVLGPEFYWSADHEYYTRLGIWNIVNQSGLHTNSNKNWCYWAKMRFP